MTMKPPRRFDTLIQAFLDNVQQNAANTSRRFEAQEQMDFTREQAEDTRAFAREQYNTQRQDYVADRALDRENQLTDQARALRSADAKELMSYMWAVDPTSPGYDNLLALITNLSTPSALTGDAAMQEALNQTFEVIGSDGQPTQQTAAITKGQLMRQAMITERNDKYLDSLMTTVISYVTDFNRSPEMRASAANILINDPNATDQMRNAILSAAGIVDPEGRRAIIDAGFVDAQTIRMNEANIRKTETEADQAAYRFQEEQDNRVYRDQEWQNKLRGQTQELNLNNLEGFIKVGALPPDEAGRQALAYMLTGGDVDALMQAGQNNYNLWVRGNVAATQLAEGQATAIGVDIDTAKLNQRVTKHNFDRQQMYEDLDDIKATIINLAAAAANGDVESIQAMAALQSSYPNTLGRININDFLTQAQTIRTDNADILETNRVLREYSVTSEALASAASLDQYIGNFADAFLPLAVDGKFDPATGTYPELEAALDNWIDNIPKTQADRLGGRDLLRRQMADAVMRRKTVQKYDNDATTLSALLEHPPAPGDEAARVLWATDVENLVTILGMDPKPWASITKGILDGNDLEWNSKAAQARLANQQADNYYQTTVGQYIDNLTGWWDYEALTNGAPNGLKLSDIKTLQEIYTAQFNAANEYATGPLCNLGDTTAVTLSGNEGLSFVGEAQGRECQYQSGLAQEASRRLSLLTGGFATDADGQQIFNPLLTQDSPAGQPIGPEVDADQAVSYINNYLASQPGGNPGDWDTSTFKQMPSEAQAIVSGLITQDGMAPNDAVDATLAKLATAQDVSDYTFRPPDNARPLSELGIDTSSQEWMRTPMEDRIARVRTSTEWQRIAARMGMASITFPELADADSAIAAILQPQTQQQAAAMQFVFGPNATPDSVEAELGRMFGIGGMTVMPQNEPGTPGYAWEAAAGVPGRIGQVFSSWFGGAPVTDPYDPHGKRTEFTPDMRTMTQAFQEDADLALQRAQDNIRSLLRAQRADDEMMAAIAPQGGSQAASGPTTPPLSGVPGMATATGSGGTGSYNMPRPGGGGDTAPSDFTEPPPAGEPRPPTNIFTSPDGFQRIRNEEGFREEAYWDNNGWAVGYGQHGPDIKQGTTVTRDEAEQLLRNHVAGVEATVRNSVQVSLNQNQWNALVSLAYNIGNGAFQQSTVVKKLNAGDYQGAADAFLEYDKSDGKVNSGLTERRRRERQLFLSPGSQPAEEPSGSSASNPIERWNRTSSARA